jgi:hypothetical protein
MSLAILSDVHGQINFPPIAYKGSPVVTTEMLARAYECEPHQIRQNFKNNKDRFSEGKHFYTLANGDIDEVRLQVESFYSQACDPKISGYKISPKARSLTLWLERGAARHAKMLNTDRAWDVFEMLEETFFRVVKPEQPQPTLPDTPITPDQQCTLQALVKALVEKGGIYAQIWSRFNNHFRLGSYKQLPQSRMSEAVDYLMRLEVEPKALPEALPARSTNALLDSHFAQIRGHPRAIYDLERTIYDIVRQRQTGNMHRTPEQHQSVLISMHTVMDSLWYAIDASLKATEFHAKSMCIMGKA